MGVHQMRYTKHLMVLALLSTLLGASQGLAQETEHHEQGQEATQEAHEDEHAEEADNEEHGEVESHGGRPHHKNEFAIFLGGTDEHGHPTEFTWGLDYKRGVA